MKEWSGSSVGEVASLEVLCGAANFRLVRAECVGSRRDSHSRAAGAVQSHALSRGAGPAIQGGDLGGRLLIIWQHGFFFPDSSSSAWCYHSELHTKSIVNLLSISFFNA